MIKLKDVPETLHAMVEIVGMEKFLEISKLYGGMSTYIPLYSSIVKEHRNRQIVETFDGSNTRQLAVKYQISTKSIRRILKETKKNNKK